MAAATNALRAHHGLAALPFQEIRGQVSNGGSALVTLALGLESGSDEHDEARQFLLDAYEQAVAVHSKLFEPLNEWLTQWHSEERLWGIVTNKPRRYTLPLLEALALTPGALLCADDLSVKNLRLSRFGKQQNASVFPPEACWYIGDHVRDMQAAKAAGMTAVAVGYGYISEEDDYQSWPADLWFTTCDELVAALHDHRTD
ncbi:phosphoglycolate phosphatase, bacterial [Vreelandella aquamarina]|nr:phosphoglycolate phosphatase, bacterial [Halomonas axialensis]